MYGPQGGGYGPAPSYGQYAQPQPPQHPACRVCGYAGPLLQLTKVSTGGWVVMVVLLFLCFPLFWIGLLMKESYAVCHKCGVKMYG